MSRMQKQRSLLSKGTKKNDASTSQKDTVSRKLKSCVPIQQLEPWFNAYQDVEDIFFSMGKKTNPSPFEQKGEKKH